MVFIRSRLLYFVLSFICLIVVPLQAAPENSIPDCFSTAWPHELSELLPDPDLTFGRLGNGFRYVLKTNREPRDRVGLFLDVQVGSLHEKETEQGIAHFLEHMLFNGSQNFDPGELVGYFQSLGMSFGGDTNAHTTYEETVYKVILPKGHKDNLDKGLLVMSDYARGALLLESEIERERGVILAEKTARDSAGFRAHRKRSTFTMDGTMIPRRNVIGDETVLRTAGRDELKDFYQTWYRPENMILVIVGDFAKHDAEELILAHFNDVRGPGDVAECPDYGTLNPQQSSAFNHFEPEQGYTDVFLEVYSDKDRQNDSSSLQQDLVQQLMATQIINYRLKDLSELPETPFSSASYYSGNLLDRYQITGIRAKTNASKWRDTLTVLEQVIRQAIEFGFSDQELARVKKEFLSEIDNSVLTQETRNSLKIANTIIRQLNNNRVILSPEQESSLYKPVIHQTSKNTLHQIISDGWQNSKWLVQVVGDAKLPGPDEERYLNEYVASLKKLIIEAPQEKPDFKFPYLKKSNRLIKPVKTEKFDSIGVTRYTYENGIIFNFKKTDFKKNEISAAIHFGDGKKSMLQPGVALLAGSVVNTSGSATLKGTFFDQVLSGSSVRYGFRIGEDSFSWEGNSLAKDAELLFQVLQAVLLDPGFRPDSYDRAMKDAELMYQQMERNVRGKLTTRIEPFLGGKRSGFGLPEWTVFQELTLEDAKGWLEPYFRDAPLEISIVGDIDHQQLIHLVSSYFGFISERHYRLDGQKELVFPAGESLEVEVDTSFDKSVVRMAWLTDDFWDIGRSRRLHVLAAVLEDRLRQVIRESLGASYSPSAYSTTSRIYPGFGLLQIQTIVENASLDSIRQKIAEVAASMVENKVDSEELERAKGPMITSLKEAVRTNRYWLSSVLSLSSRYPQQLHWPLEMIDDYSSVSTEEINVLAARYLIDSRRATGIVRPRK